jgi:hypothetical protein
MTGARDREGVAAAGHVTWAGRDVRENGARPMITARALLTRGGTHSDQAGLGEVREELDPYSA